MPKNNNPEFGVSLAAALAAVAFKEGADKAPVEQFADGEELFVEEHDYSESEEPTEREEWEAKPALAPELEVFLGSVRDASELLFGNKGQVQEVVGTKNANDNPYDGGELLSREEQRSQEWEDETPGERDTTVDVEERNAGPNTLQYAYAVLVWSYTQLPADVQAEFSRKFKRLKTYLQNRARNIGCELIEGVFPCNRETPLEEYTQGFREEPVDHKVIEDLKGKRKYRKAQKQESLLEWVKKFK